MLEEGCKAEDGKESAEFRGGAREVEGAKGCKDIRGACGWSSLIDPTVLFRREG